MYRGVKVDPQTGAIISFYRASSVGNITIQETEDNPVFLVAEDVDPSVSYMAGDSEIIPRPEMQLAIPDSGTVGQPYRVENIPEGTTLYYPGGETVVNDGYFEWSTVESGIYQFTLSNFPYQEVQINADFSAV